MKCPYCGALLQENAQFCLYCMKPLREKTQLAALPAKKRSWVKRLALLLSAAAVVAVGVVLAVRLGQPKAREETAPQEPPVAWELPAGEVGQITDSNSFYFDAIEVTKRLQGEELWEPKGLALVDMRDRLLVYSAPLYLQGVSLQVYFFDDGMLLFTAITDLTEDTLADGLRLADCVATSVYYGMGGETIRLEDCTPTETVAAGDSCVERLQIEDSAASRSDGAVEVRRCRLTPELEPYWQEAAGIPTQYMLYEVRARVYEGCTYYDIFLYHGQE